jgi:hypothetical protein
MMVVVITKFLYQVKKSKHDSGGDSLEQQITPIKCPHCGYIWLPRMTNPKRCPQCKQPLQKTELQLQREAEKKEQALMLVRVREPIQGKDVLKCTIPGCILPAMFRFESENEKCGLCKEHLLQKIDRIRQLTNDEVMKLYNQRNPEI